MRWGRISLLGGGLCACGGSMEISAWTPEEPACSAGDVMELEGGLHAHLLHSTDGGATWDYVPDRPLEARVKGTWDLVTGEFSWVRTYDDDHWRKAEKVEGLGTAWPNGDLDVRYLRRLERLGAKAQERELRIVRQGCEQEATERSPDGKLLAVERGTWGRKGYAYTIERLREGAVVPIEGLLRWDRRRTEEEAWRVGDHEYVATREDDGAGTVLVTYREVVDGVVYEGTMRQRRDGVECHLFTQVHPAYTAHWDYWMDVRGNGEGFVTFEAGIAGPLTCDVEFRRGACELDCPGNAFTTCGLPR